MLSPVTVDPEFCSTETSLPVPVVFSYSLEWLARVWALYLERERE
jgi:hypothetical protein